MTPFASISAHAQDSGARANCCGEVLRPFWDAVETGLLESGSLGGFIAGDRGYEIHRFTLRGAADGNTTVRLAGQRQVGFVFQHYALFRHLTVLRNITFGLEVRPRKLRPKRADATKRALDLLKLVQLDGLDQRFPPQLSGGQRQRVALARALAVEPKVLLLDEPFGALDAKVRKDLRRWLRGFQEEIGITTIFVTHDQEEALELADEVVVLNEGQIEQIGSPQHVYDRPASPFVIEFLGNVNRFRAGLAAPEDDSKGVLYVRPHDVEIEASGASEHEYALQARVLHIFSAGNTGRVALERVGTHEPFEVEVSRERLRQLQLQPGALVTVVFRHVRLFEDGRYREGDVRGGRFVPADIA